VLVKWLLVLGATAVAGYYAVKLVDALRGVPALELEATMREIEGERDAQRAAFVNQCAGAQIARLAPKAQQDQDVLRGICRDCYGLGEDSFPQRPVAPAAAGGGALTVALIGAAVLGGVYLAMRWRS